MLLIPDISRVVELLFLRILKLADEFKELLGLAPGDRTGHPIVKDHRAGVEVDLLHQVALVDPVKAVVFLGDLTQVLVDLDCPKVARVDLRGRRIIKKFI